MGNRRIQPVKRGRHGGAGKSIVQITQTNDPRAMPTEALRGSHDDLI